MSFKMRANCLRLYNTSNKSFIKKCAFVALIHHKIWDFSDHVLNGNIQHWININKFNIYTI